MAGRGWMADCGYPTGRYHMVVCMERKCMETLIPRKEKEGDGGIRPRIRREPHGASPRDDTNRLPGGDAKRLPRGDANQLPRDRLVFCAVYVEFDFFVD